ncbi:MAG: AMP-binding protein [Pseudomonadota bacterium]
MKVSESPENDRLRQLNLRAEPDDRYRIEIPEYANIAQDTVAKHAAGPRADAAALIFEAENGAVERTSYAALDALASAFAGSLGSLGIGAGDRVAIHTGQRPATAIAHLATYKLGAIAVTVSELYGPDTVSHILTDSGAAAIVTSDQAWAPYRNELSRFPELRHVIALGELADGELPLDSLLSGNGRDFEAVRTKAEDPALLIYTSGSTGAPKGILHAHRAVHAYNVSTSLFYNLEVFEPNLVFWTPADWAWVGGLNDTVFPAWMHGHAMVACQHRFETEWALDFMARHGVTHGFFTPTALKRLTQAERPRERYDVKLRSVFTGGESLPAETLRWLSEELKITCNEGYGLTEVNHMIGNCQALRLAKPGSMGFELPGHVAALVDEAGEPVPDGEVGEIVTSADNATRFLGYWNQPELTQTMRLGPWWRTGDLALRDPDGYYLYRGRTGDLIKSAGFRIGPAEIEHVLLEHPAVADCGAIGVQDPDRGEVVKVVVRLHDGHDGDDQLAQVLKDLVRSRLGGFKAPRLVEFVGELPITSSGKVSRKELRRREAEQAGP